MQFFDGLKVRPSRWSLCNLNQGSRINPRSVEASQLLKPVSRLSWRRKMPRLFLESRSGCLVMALNTKFVNIVVILVVIQTPREIETNIRSKIMVHHIICGLISPCLSPKISKISDFLEFVLYFFEAFLLYDSHGFPLDLTEQMALEAGLTVDVAGFEARLGNREGASSLLT